MTIGDKKTKALTKDKNDERQRTKDKKTRRKTR